MYAQHAVLTALYPHTVLTAVQQTYGTATLKQHAVEQKDTGVRINTMKNTHGARQTNALNAVKMTYLIAI